MPAGELWQGIQELQNAVMLYLASLMTSTMGASAGTEGLFTKIYEKLVRREGDPGATTFLMGYDNIPIRAEKSLYDLAEWARTKPELAAHLLGTATAELVEQLVKPIPLIPSPLSPDFATRFRTHLDQFGFIIYNLDYARRLPMDDPTPMVEAIKMYLRGQGMNPHMRQKQAEERRLEASQNTLSRLKGLRGWAFRTALKYAQRLAEVREDALALIGLGYPVLRRMLFTLGDRFAEAGSIEQAGDIFWLEKAEIDASLRALEGDQPITKFAEAVSQRKSTWKALENVTPPSMLPPKKKYMGFNVSSFVGASEDSQVGNTLKGIAASTGKVTAKACILLGPEDFDLMQPGDVLVAAITTPAWTPLFAMAAAVVTDIGGPLSHGSIVAREYGIPAVMGTGVATKRIRNGQVITVDGTAGVVEIL
jgi:rifampicin phosphotransferase